MELKDLLNEEMYANYLAIQEALKGKGPQGRDVELVATNTGDYVPASKYDKLKADYAKVDTDYKTLDSKYATDIASAKAEGETLVKKVLLENMLEKANVTKVNNSYDYLNSSLDLSNVKLEGSKLVGADDVINNFVTANPNLVIKGAESTATAPATTQNPAVPPANGLNPATPVANVKDMAYYKDLHSKATDLETKVEIKLQAAKDGIII